MKRSLFIVVLSYLAINAFKIGWAQTEEHRKGWTLDKENLTFTHPDGTSEVKVNLGNTESKGPSDKDPYQAHKIDAALSQDGTHAFVHETDEKIANHLRSITRVASYYDANNKMLWKRAAVSRYWISDTGKVVLLVITTPEECSQETTLLCSEKLISVDEQGRDILKQGPYAMVSHVWMSESNRYGGADVAEDGRHKYIFFSTAEPKAKIKLSKLPGGVRVKNDGRVEFLKPIYGPIDDKGRAAILRTEIVQTIRIN
jgi:hypothetical protein